MGVSELARERRHGLPPATKRHANIIIIIQIIIIIIIIIIQIVVIIMIIKMIINTIIIITIIITINKPDHATRESKA